MSFICRISNKIAKEPTISKHGNIFDKSSVIDYIKENNRCPLTGLELFEKDLYNIGNFAIENKEDKIEIKEKSVNEEIEIESEKEENDNIFLKYENNFLISQIEILEKEKEQYNDFISELLEKRDLLNN